MTGSPAVARVERHQVWLHLAAVAVGLGVGTWVPTLAAPARVLVWPALVLLLYATFCLVPPASLRAAVTDRRFLAAALVGNFLAVPLLVGVLLHWAPDDAAVRLGLALVLLVPCTDWFITFARLGGGDVARATAWTPIALVLQLALAPLWLWLLLGDTSAAAALTPTDLWPAAVVVLAPLVAALLTVHRAQTRGGRARLVGRSAPWPVPLLAAVVLMVAVAHAQALADQLALLPHIGALAVAFLAGALLLARALAAVARLPVAAGRTLAFSLGTRNSFVVLPIALALPAGWGVAAPVVVMQSLVELIAMIVCIRLVPGLLFPVRRRPRPEDGRGGGC